MTTTKTDPALEMAWSRGRQGAPRTTEDRTDPAQRNAYTLGAAYRAGDLVMEPHTYTGCGCARCRLLDIQESRGR